MSLPPRVVLHVGMAKAGSTALQNALAENRDALLAQGVLFPLSVLRRTNPLDPARTPGHLDLLRRIGDPDNPLLAECAAAPGARTLLLSIENLFNIESPANVARLAGFLAGREVTLLAVLRAPQDWAAARHYELVTAGLASDPRPIDRFLEQALAAGALDYPRRLETLAAAFRARRVAVLEHDAVARGAGIVAAALAEIGVALPAAAAAPDRRVNVTRAYPEAIEAQRRLNPLARALPPARRFAFAAAMKAIAADLAGAGLLRPGGAPISAPMRRALVAATEEPCRAASRRWLGGRPFGPDAAWAEAEPPAPDAALTARIQDLGFAALMAEAEAAERESGGEDGEDGGGRPGRGGRAGFAAGAAETRLLREALEGARVVLEYGSGRSTLLAASLPGRLVLSVEDSRDRAVRMQIRLDHAAPPSPAVVWRVDPAAGPDPARRYAEAIWDQPFFRHPDLVLIGGRFRAACLAAVAARVARPTRVLVADHPRRPREERPGAPRPERLIGRMAEFRLAPAAAPA